MKEGSGVFHEFARRGVGIVCAALLVAFPFGVPLAAQDVVPAQPPVSQPAAQPAPAPLTPAQLDDLVAPIALYPDQLLSQVLVASTYPLELVEASQWLQQNNNLQGQQLMDAARQQNWDPSVQALVAMPDVLNRLTSDVNWTTALGNAFLSQQSDVMSAVQRMRAQAQANGKLSSSPQETVTTQTDNGQTAIQIVPANPQVIYVPQYNPEYIWGPPAWGYYPDLYYPAFGFGFDSGIYLSAFFGGWGGWGWGGWGWGWGPNWFAGNIFVNRPFFSHYGFGGYYGGGFGRGIWAHNPAHRWGVPYNNRALATRFGGNYAGRSGFVRGNGIAAREGNFRGGAFRGNSFRSNSFRGNSFGGNTRSFGSASRGAAGGNWQHFGGSNALGAQRGGATGARSFGSTAGRAPAAGRGGQWNHFNGAGGAPANRGAAGNAYRSAPSYGGGRSFGGSSPAYRAPGNGGGFRSAPSFGGSRSFSGSRPSFNGGASRSFSGGGARSFGGGGSRSFSGGGGSHSFGGGGGFHGGGGGGFHGGGGGSHGGGGGHGGRR